MFLIAFLSFFWAVTAQNYHPDQLTFQGTTYPYRYHHMEQYFKTFPNKRPVPLQDSTLIHRGYIAEFEIGDDGMMVIKDLKINLDPEYKKLKSRFQQVLQSNGKPVHLYWVSGLYEVGIGQPIHWLDSLYPTYSSYYVLEINRGKLSRVNTFTQKQMETFKAYQWNRYKHTSAYSKTYEQLRLSGLKDSEIINHMYFHVLFYSKKNYLKK